MVDDVDIEVLIKNGIELDKQKKYSEALEYFEKVFLIDSNNLVALGFKVIILAKLERYGDAESLFQKVIEIDPKNIYALRGKGISLISQEKYDEALFYFNKALQIDPNNIDVLNNKGLVLSYQENYDEALVYFNKALKIDSNNIEALNNKGCVLFTLGKSEEAREYFNKALKIDPNYTQNFDNKEEIFQYSEEYQLEKECSDNNFEIDLNYMYNLNRKGYNFALQEKYDEALFYFNKALSIDKSYLFALIGKARILYRLGEYDEALVCFNKALQKVPDNIKILYQKGIFLLELKNYEEALVCFNKALQIDPNNIDVLNNKGLVLYYQGEYGDAINCYNQILKINPNNIDVLVNKAEALIGLNLKDKAMEICKLLKSLPNLNDYFYLRLMGLFSNLNDYSSVEEVFNKSLKSMDIYEAYNQIIKINAEPNLKEKQRLQNELYRVSYDNRQKQQMIEFLKKQIEIDIKELKESVKEEGEKGRECTKKESKITHEIVISESEKTREEMRLLVQQINKKLSEIKQDGEISLSKLTSVDDKIDKLGEISDKIYNNMEILIENKLISPKDFVKKKGQLLGLYLGPKYDLNFFAECIKLQGKNYDIFDIITSAELLFDDSSDYLNTGFDFGCVIILYCKAIEILEKKKCEKLKEIIEKIIDESYELQKVTDKHHENKQKVVHVYIKKNEYLDKMINETKREPYEDGTSNPIFKYSKAGKKLTTFMNYEVSGDMYMYNTLLFIYYVETKKIDDSKFQFFKKIYELYIDERNGSAHTHLKTWNDLITVRDKVMNENNIKNSYIYRLIHEI